MKTAIAFVLGMVTAVAVVEGSRLLLADDHIPFDFMRTSQLIDVCSLWPGKCPVGVTLGGFLPGTPVRVRRSDALVEFAVQVPYSTISSMLVSADPAEFFLPVVDVSGCPPGAHKH